MIVERDSVRLLLFFQVAAAIMSSLRSAGSIEQFEYLIYLFRGCRFEIVICLLLLKQNKTQQKPKIYFVMKPETLASSVFTFCCLRACPQGRLNNMKTTIDLMT